MKDAVFKESVVNLYNLKWYLMAYYVYDAVFTASEKMVKKFQLQNPKQKSITYLIIYLWNFTKWDFFLTYNECDL